MFIIVRLLIFLVFLGIPMAAQATDDTVIFALFTRGWAPFEMTVGREATGVATDIFREVMPANVNAVVELDPTPRKYLYHATKPVYTRLEAKEWVDPSFEYLWSDPVVKLESVLYSSAETPVEFTGVEGLEGKIIGCVRNYTYPRVEPLFEAEKAQRYDVNKEHLLLRMVKAGRVDVAVMDAIQAKWLIRNSNEFDAADFHVSAAPVSVVDLRFVFNMAPGWDKRLPEVNARIKKIQENGKLDEIFSKYR